MGAELTLISRTLLVTVFPTGTAPKLIAPGETLRGPVADEFVVYPQPDSATAALDINTTNSCLYRLSNLRIELRLRAQFELNNRSPLCKTCKFSRGR
jgi:hypothetical protein